MKCTTQLRPSIESKVSCNFFAIYSRIIAAIMPKYLYLVVTCKTPGCGNVCAVRYHGIDQGATAIGELTPVGFTYECGLCHKPHRYAIEESRIEDFDFPPPKGWQDAWEPGSGQPQSPGPKKIQ